MARAPISFVCKNCGVDNSAAINQLIREQFGVAAPASAVSANPSRLALAPMPTTEAVTARVNLRAGTPPPPPASAVSVGSAAPVRVIPHKAPVATEHAPVAPSGQLCLKHPGQLATQQCLICQKPICPECMEVFGYVCSALCKANAARQGIDVPVYEQSKSATDARQWRKLSLIAGSCAAVVAVVLGVWFWYAWFASQPKPIFSVRFQKSSGSGQCRLLPQNQVVFLHGGTLARHDLKTKREIWSQELIDYKKIEVEAAAAIEQMKVDRDKAKFNGVDINDWLIPRPPEVIRNLERSAQDALQLHALRESVWVSSPDKLTRYEWQTGKAAQQIPIEASFRSLVPSGDELLLIAENENGRQIRHFNLVSGDTRTEEISRPRTADASAGGPGANRPARASRIAGSASAKGVSNQVAMAAKPNARQPTASLAASKAGPSGPKPLNPAAIANQVQGLSRPSKLALPAVLAANANQQRLAAEMRDQPETAFVDEGFPGDGFENNSLVPDGNKWVELSVKLVESKSIERQAMKAPPKKSALDGDVTAASTEDVANEILNEIQRDRGGDVLKEDVSRYRVTLRRPGAPQTAEWVGEVTGQPALFPLQTVDVLVAGKSVVVLDKTNKKLWETKLSFGVSGGSRTLPSDEIPEYGEGPAVEREDTLYLFDQGVLSAFELATGNARWRLPLVGVAGLHFDGKGMLYVNASSASPQILRYPNQIDISQKDEPVILKVNGKTGKTLWQIDREGLVSYVSGKFIYTTETYHGVEVDEGLLSGVKTGLEIPPHIRLKRIDPGNGRVLWEYYEKHAPLDVRFEKNMIQLLFRKELQVLTFFAL